MKQEVPLYATIPANKRGYHVIYFTGTADTSSLTGYGDIQQGKVWEELPKGLPIIHHSWDSALIALELVNSYRSDAKEYLQALLQLVPTHGGKVVYK
tara:strand:- start:14676 stop:14966 length:291 start_codon:yes stop_codon:yes gene_type:complete